MIPERNLISLFRNNNELFVENGDFKVVTTAKKIGFNQIKDS